MAQADSELQEVTLWTTSILPFAVRPGVRSSRLAFHGGAGIVGYDPKAMSTYGLSHHSMEALQSHPSHTATERLRFWRR